MRTLLSWFWFCVLYYTLTRVDAYYMSPNKFTFDNGRSYCINYCHSDMASIKNNAQYQEAIHTMQSGQLLFNTQFDKHVYIGLHTDSYSANFTWVDGTPWTFGSNISIKGTYPWAPNQPDDPIPELCAQIYVDSNYQWDDASCNFNRRTLCNSCNSILNKYFMIIPTATYNTARSQCQSYGTSLASFHSDRDYQELSTLCSITNNNNCWIGLRRIWNESTWFFEDDTNFDNYKYSAFSGVEWISDKYYMALNHNNGYLMDDMLENNNGYPLCNMPSELCQNVSNWTLIEGNMTFKSCRIMSTGHGINVAVISNKYWLNENGILLIEYMYSLLPPIFTTVTEYIGLIIYTSPALCEYYVIQVSYSIHQQEMGLHLKYFIGDNNFELYSIIIGDVSNFNAIEYNTLFVEISFWYINTLRFNVSFNNIKYFVYDHNVTSVSPFRSGYSGYIGIRSENAVINSKSLYVSGTPLLTNEMQLNCVVMQTAYPTQSPTNTNQPSTSPIIPETFCDGTDAILIGISFSYKLEKDNITSNQIMSTLSNVTNSFIQLHILQMTQCYFSDQQIDIVLNDDINTAFINASVCFLCDNNQQLNIQFVDNTLEKEFIVIISNSTQLLTVISNTTIIKTVIKVIDMEVNAVETTISVRTSIYGKEDNKSTYMNLSMILIISAFVVICFILIFATVIIQIKKRKQTEGMIIEMNKTVHTESNESNTHNTINDHNTMNDPVANGETEININYENDMEEMYETDTVERKEHETKGNVTKGNVTHGNITQKHESNITADTTLGALSYEFGHV
eukprot:429194_1